MKVTRYVTCVVCGFELEISEWRKIPRRIGVYPQLFMKVGTAYFDFCSDKCMKQFEIDEEVGDEDRRRNKNTSVE